MEPARQHRGNLEKKGYDVLITRDPGGNPISEAIREVILNKEFTEMGYMTELLLYASARAQLVKENIKPALEAGQAVIADRFVDSSAVYQGIEAWALIRCIRLMNLRFRGSCLI